MITKLLRVVATLPLLVCLAGCPTAERSKVAQAVDNISIIAKGFQQAEIVAHSQGLIPDDEHRFIEQQMLSLATAGKAADSCITSATDSKGYVACVDTAVRAVDGINAQGGTYLKSEKAKLDFGIAMSSIKTVLVSVETVLGGNQ